ncbi:glycine cleavage system aminomethyltransferase GcvT [Reinekea thalattae]|uniref:Aminomethyltransferase n=1 Tax=Reinekea thalattae TaxID=2593301 RepID=A0A5C8Z7N7_9GAMM|nr:glycine cleavage system aminomethyltransferase GcvT [Reinekea thalattae]TXR53258.1 glycine cleavage system aminomethyltransferase GcvT [Reinekea thalattae]
MANKTPLYEAHLKSGGKMVDFSGWQMPINYGSQKTEHTYVRESAGMFDVSHMTIVDVEGPQASDFLRYLLANDVARLKSDGKALYTALLNEQAGILDDLIVYKTDLGYRTVVNCATREKDLAWFNQHGANFDVQIQERPELAMIAVQGPNALERSQQAFNDTQSELISQLSPFQGLPIDDWFIARTGYTGEDGLEIMLPAEQATAAWQALLDAGVQPCGLGARDTLRLEAGMNLYGNDMTEQNHPLESAMAWTVAWQPEERDFIGRQALTAIKNQANQQKLVGLVLDAKGVMRAEQKVYASDETTLVGELTSGSFSPTLNQSIAIARVDNNIDEQCWVDIRGKKLPATVISLPFVRMGKKQF